MKRRTIMTILVAIPALLVSSVLLAWWWLLHTEPGARWVFDKAVAAGNVPVGVRNISGDLYSGLQLDGLHFEEAGTRADVEILRVAINLDLLPFALEVTTLQAENIRIQITPDSGTQPREKDPPGAFVMPFPLTFREVRISGLEYLDPSGEASFLISSIEGAGSLEEALVLDRLSISHQENRLDLSGRIAGAPPYPLALKFQSQGLVAVEGSLNGDLDSTELVLDLLEPQAHVSGTLGQLLGVPVWNLDVNSPSLQLPPGHPDPAAKLSLLQVQISGEWPQFNLDLAATLEIPGLEPAQLTVSGNGSLFDFTAQKLTLQGPELSVDATGTFSWEDTFSLDLNAVLERLEPGTWIPDWPQDHPVTGHIVIGWEGEDVAVNDFSLAVSGTSLVVNGHGIVAPESGLVDVALNWENFSWPIASTSPFLASREGSLEISGQPQDWQLAGTLDLQSGDFPPGRMQLTGTGDDESLNLTVQEGKVLGGTISSNVSWKWTGDQPFKAEVLARQVETGPLFPDYPGTLNTRLAFNGEVDPFRLAVEIQQLDGTIRAHPVTGQGGLTIEHGRVFADHLHLGSGTATLTLDGSLYEPGGIDFATRIDSLEQLSADYRGSLDAQGNISLNPASPRISVSMSGQDLDFGSVKIGQVETRRPSGSGLEDGSEFILSGLVIGQQDVEELTIGFAGDEPFQRIAVNARVDGADIALDLRGSVNDWADPAGSGWRGELSGLQMDYLGQFALTLEQPAPLEWTPSHFKLESTCLTGTDDARLCVASNWLEEDRLNISADLAGIPVGLIGMLFDTEFRFSQILNGTLDWSQSTTDGRRGTAQFEISPGAISLQDDDEILLETGAGRFGFEVDRGVLSKGDLDLDIPGTGDINVDFNIPDFSLGAYSLVRGKVRVDFHDLTALGPILPLFDSINGDLEIDVNLSGIILDPAFEGKASLTDGHFANKASGFAFSEINLTGDVDEMDRSRLTGTFRAGEGSGNINATIYFEDLFSPVIELSLEGKSLTIIDVPDLNVIADPDLVLGWRNGALEIDGRVFIPKARLAPSYIPQASVRQSADVVIVSGTLPEPEDDYLRDNPLKIRGSVEIELGKQAQIDLEMAKVSVFGTTRFTWQDELLPKADGNFDVRGEIQAYGQFLKITQGRIGFPDIPADNPYLNIRAERDIYGNSQIQKAGLMVSGTLKRPLIEPYTIPMTNKDRARTLLVTGSDFNYEQGVGAVAVGAYVLPRLYISYGIGVFEDGNVISARYDLGKRFGIKATSGQNDTGVDLNYTIER